MGKGGAGTVDGPHAVLWLHISPHYATSTLLLGFYQPLDIALVAHRGRQVSDYSDLQKKADR